MQALAFINPTTAKEYQGGNIARLQDSMDGNPGFVSGQFATFRQWLSVGRVVAKGQKSCARLVAFKGDGPMADKEDQPKKDKEPNKKGFLQGFSVFALEQTTIYEPKDEPTTPADTVPDIMPSHVAIIAPAPITQKPVSINATALRDKADSILAKAAQCMAERQTNTAKRLGQAMHKRMEGSRLERQGLMLQALACLIENGEALPAFAHGLSVSALVKLAADAAPQKAQACQNGYHTYHVETGEPLHASDEHTAFRALLDPLALESSRKQAARIQADAELRQCDIAGFFPTPRGVVDAMLEYAGDLTGKSVLEPSAGKGDLVQAALDAGAKTVTALEVVPRLAAYIGLFLTGKVVTQCVDFMTQEPVLHDVILMNPPFERDQAITHVTQAMRWMGKGGRLVAVMPAGWSGKALADRLHQTADILGLSVMEVDLEARAFKSAFNSTGVNTSLVVIY